MSQGVDPSGLAARIDAVQWPTGFDTYHVTDAPPLEITFSFHTDRPDDLRPTSWTDVAGWGSYTEAEKAAVRAGLDEYARVLNVTFTEVEYGTENEVDLTFLRASQGVSGGRGRFQYTTWPEFDYDGFVLFNTNRDMSAPQQFNLILHEIGHAFSLKHPGNYDVNPANAPPGPYLSVEEDNYRFTVMSYSPNPQLTLEPDTLMLYDIAALQERWGANMTTATGDDSYGLRTDGNLYVIWDAGGSDWIDLATRPDPVALRLGEGQFTTVGGADRIAVGYGVAIEHGRGGSGSDQILGNALANRLEGGLGHDTLQGGAGDDTLDGGAGNDRAEGGEGTDRFVLTGVTRAQASASQGADGLVLIGSALGQDSLFGIEEIVFDDGTVSVAELLGLSIPGEVVTGTDGADTLSGTGDDDTITGGDGDDLIAASSGQDTVAGGAGDDLIGGGPGSDTIAGEDGHDTIGAGQGNDQANGGAGNDIVNGGPGNDTLTGASGDDTMGASFGDDSLLGGSGDDSLGGGTGRDTLEGGVGNDAIGGGEGDDRIAGGAGDDFLAGGGRNDIIDGGDGADRVNGGAGDDTLTGGLGNDLFLFNALTAGEADVITDFEDGADRLRLSGVAGQGAEGKFAALALSDVAGGVQIGHQGHTILLEGVAVTALGPEDFIFL